MSKINQAVAETCVVQFMSFETANEESKAARIVMCNAVAEYLGAPNDNAPPAWSMYEPLRVLWVKQYATMKATTQAAAIAAWGRYYRECGYKAIPKADTTEATKKADKRQEAAHQLASMSDEEIADVLETNASALASALNDPEERDLDLADKLTKVRATLRAEQGRRAKIEESNNKKARALELENETEEQRASRSALVAQAKTADIQDVQRALKVFERQSKAA